MEPGTNTQAPPPPAGSARWVHVGIAAVALVQLLGLYSAVSSHLRGGAGVELLVYDDGVLSAWPTTQEADRTVAGLPRPIAVIAVNGRTVAALADLGEAWELLDRRAGIGVNRLVLRDAAGKVHRLQFRAGDPVPRIVYRWRYPELTFWVVGLLYLALGVFVWRRRPMDRTARALLLFTLVAGFNSALSVLGGRFGLTVLYLRFASFSFWAPSTLYFGLVFTQSDRKRWARWTLRLMVAAAATLSVVRLATVHLLWRRAPVADLLRDTVVTTTSALLLVALGVVVWNTWLATRSPHPPAVRRRARALVWSLLLGFLFPSLSGVLWPHVTSWEMRAGLVVLVMLCLASFPVNMTVAILRLQMFDLRVVLRQGLVYVIISVAVSLGYLLLVFFAFGLVGRHSQLPLAIAGVIVVALVLVFSVLKVRVQRAVDRLVFRSRYLYAGAISRASARLSRAHTLEAVLATLQDALVERMRLSRVFLASPGGDGPETLRVRVIAAGTPPNAERIPQALPERFEVERFAPVARAVRTRQPAYVYDSQAVEAGAQGSTEDEEGLTEASFWSAYGVDLVIPLLVGEQTVELMGVLLVGPKRDGRPVDSGDRELLETLANQIAMALESARAFAQIARLKDGLEQQVQERTSELTEALRELQQTQSQLVESETLATLARVVAGVVHELNSPLGGLRSVTDSLRRLMERSRSAVERLPQENVVEPTRVALARLFSTGGDLLQVMEGSSERIQSVVSSLAQFVSLDEAPYKAIELRDGLEGALQLLKPQLQSGIEVERCYCAERVVVQANPARLNQVLFNLLENAMKALEGAGRIEVGLDRREGRAVVTIRDDGRGIPAEQLPRIFEFGFGKKASGRVGMRTGLVHGKRVIEQLGGKIDVTSRPAEGTTVTVSLPTV